MDKHKYNNMESSGKSLVTVITVVFNKKEDLEKTIQSVISQTYKNIEYIVIDGGSTDGTLDVIKKYQHVINAWISEPDKGIYDAMNKGIGLASGDWVNFMNAGDEFYNCSSIELLKNYFQEKAVLIYGDVKIAYNGLERTQQAERFSRIWGRMVCCHQSVFIKKQILAEYMFDTGYPLAADYDLLCKIYLCGYPVIKVDMIISTVIVGGQSDVRRIEVLREFLRISSRTFKTRAIFIYLRYQSLILLEEIKKHIKKYLPEQVVCFFIKHKYRETKIQSYAKN